MAMPRTFKHVPENAILTSNAHLGLNATKEAMGNKFPDAREVEAERIGITVMTLAYFHRLLNSLAGMMTMPRTWEPVPESAILTRNVPLGSNAFKGPPGNLFLA